MTTESPDLHSDRDLGRLLNDSFAIYRRHFRTLLAAAATVIVPVELAVSGFGLGQLTSGFDEKTSVDVAIVQTGVAMLVITPLLTAMVVNVVVAAAKGGAPPASQVISAGFDHFAPLLGAILLATAGIFLGALLLIVPGIFLAVRWYVVAQAVVVDGRRGTEALARSWELVRGHSWFTFGVLVLTNLLGALAAGLISIPGQVGAEAADAQAIALAGSIVAEILTLPFLAVTGTLLYFTLKVRAGEVAPRAPEPTEPAEPAEPAEPQADLHGWQPPVPPA